MPYELLYLLSIVFMIFVIFTVSAMIAGMPHNMYKCFASYIFWGDDRCVKWLFKKNNIRYIIYHVFIVAIIGIGLHNLGQLQKEDIFTRTAFVQHMQPVFWLCLVYVTIDYKKLYDILNTKQIK